MASDRRTDVLGFLAGPDGMAVSGFACGIEYEKAYPLTRQSRGKPFHLKIFDF